jgi:predicted DNA-binding ribbon-helix-helix protein
VEDLRQTIFVPGICGEKAAFRNRRSKTCALASDVHSACELRIGASAGPRSRRIARQKETHMKSPIVKRSIVIGGHKTSVSLEDAFWRGLKDIAHDQHLTLSNMVATIDKARQQSNLSSAIRLFVLDRLRTQTQIPGFSASQDGVASTQMIRGNILTHA